MRYKAVCEELWKNRVDDSGACCIVLGKEKQPVGDSRPSLKHGCNMRGMRANNKNKHPRSEARKHMGLRIYRRSKGGGSRAFEGARA
jgi:hypothetical protein